MGCISVYVFPPNQLEVHLGGNLIPYIGKRRSFNLILLEN